MTERKAFDTMRSGRTLTRSKPQMFVRCTSSCLLSIQCGY